MMRKFLTTSLMLTLAAASGCVALPGLPPSLQRPQGAFQSGQVMVAWTAETPLADREAVKSRLGLVDLPGRGDRFELLSVPDGAELDTCRRLRGERGVAVAEPNYVVRSRHVAGSLKVAGSRRLQYVPKDQAWGLNLQNKGLNQEMLWGLKAIKADQAWDTTQGDSGITVAVIDTGVDMTHPDLAGNLDTANALNVLEAGRPVDDDFGHGTHVAGIIAAVGDNRQGALGVAFKTRVMPIRVLGVDGSGTLADLVYAIDHAVAKGAHVINMSLGSPDRSELEGEAIKDALAKGVVVVAAAGNEATTGNYAEYPASYPGVLSVGAVGPDLKRAPFSNFNSSVTVVAPGVDIFSTLPVRFGKDNPYGYLSGTSMAAPMVAGAAALVLAAHPTWTPEQVASRLRKTAQNLAVNDEVLDYSPFFGDGLIDAAAAVR